MKKLWGAVVILVGAVFFMVGIVNVFVACSPMGEENTAPEVASRLMGRAIFGFVLVVLSYYAMRAGRRRLSPPPPAKTEQSTDAPAAS